MYHTRQTVHASLRPFHRRETDVVNVHKVAESWASTIEGQPGPADRKGMRSCGRLENLTQKAHAGSRCTSRELATPLPLTRRGRRAGTREQDRAGGWQGSVFSTPLGRFRGGIQNCDALKHRTARPFRPPRAPDPHAPDLVAAWRGEPRCPLQTASHSRGCGA